MTSPPPSAQARSARALSVLMAAEGTYPYHFGGVSTWCQAVIECLPQVEFHVLAVSDHPGKSLRFDLPGNVASLENRAVWGLPYLDRRPAWNGLLAAPATEHDELVDAFLPAFRTFLTNVLGRTLDAAATADALATMHAHFLRHGFERTMRSELVWQAGHADLALILADLGPSSGVGYVEPTMADVVTVTTWLRHWLAVIGEPIPKTDIVHAAMAGLCTLVCVTAQRHHGARFLLTEHGVYLREVYLAEAQQANGLLKLVRIRWARRMTELSYARAEQISPCCDFNQRWELRNGADASKLRTIYYGIDPARFTPEERAIDGPPVVVWAGRINPLKDVETLLRAAAIVCEERPDATFLLFGAAGDEDHEYEARCRALWRELQLEEKVLFRGFTDRVDLAFGQGDLVVLPSISEGFPNVTLEAMLCERPVVVTAVGGLPEQIGAAGLAVEPRNPAELAEGILALLDDGETRQRLGRVARERAASRFTMARLRDEHLTTYERLLAGLGADAGLGVPSDEESVTWRAVRVGAAAGAPADGAPSDGASVGEPGRGHTRVLVDTGGARGGGPADHRDLDDDAASLRLQRLVDEVAAQSAEPVDALEVAAVLESLGMNDGLARDIHGVDDVFALGDLVLLELRARNWGREWWRTPGGSMAGELRLPRRQGLAALAASLLVLATVQLARLFGHWDSAHTMSFVVGVSAGMAVANGLVLAVARPISFFLANQDRPLAHELLRRSRWLGATIVLSFGAAMVVLLEVIARPAAGVVLVAAVGYVALVATWVPLGIVSMLGLGHRAAWPVGAGVLVFVAVDRLNATWLSWHLAVASAAGVGMTLLGFALVMSRALPEGAHRRSRIVPSSMLGRGSGSYFAFGVLTTAPLLLPHALVWARQGADSIAWHGQMTAVELGLTLSLVPVIASVGAADGALRRFWVTLSVSLSTTPAVWPERLRDRLVARRQARLFEYLRRLAVATAIFGAVVVVAVALGATDHISGRSHRGMFLWSFVAGLLGYLLYAWGSFTTMHAVSLGRPRAGIAAVLAAAVAVTAIGVPLVAQVHAWAAGPLVVLACAVYGGAATFTVNRTFGHASQLFASIS